MHRTAPLRASTLVLALILALSSAARANEIMYCGAARQVVVGDFNGDGRQDLAIGSPESFVAENSAGLVHVIYGTDNGLGQSVLPQQIWHQDSPGVPGDPANFNLFGYALAVGDFDCDGIDDLAIGEDEAVTVLYGSTPDGLTATGSQRLIAPSESDYGRALAAGYFSAEHGCSDDLVVGAPDGVGRIYFYSGEEGTGLLPETETLIYQDTPGVPGSNEGGDNFGKSLAVGNFDNDPYDDLAVGVPGENIGSQGKRDGAVNILYGDFNGFELDRSQIWSQASSYVPGESESWDSFGYSLAVGDFKDNGNADLIVGVPGETDEGSFGLLSPDETSTGAVNIFYGTPNGLETTSDDPGGFWWQDSENIEGKSESWDHFGAAVASGDFNGDGYGDMAVGVPYEKREGFVVNGGVVNVIYGGANGLEADDDQILHQATSGVWIAGEVVVQGIMEDHDYFGCWLAAGPLDADEYDDLVVMVNDGPGIGFNVIPGSESGLFGLTSTTWHCDGLAGCVGSREFLNLPSAHAPITDGIYTDPPGTGEWSDVQPLAFAIGAQGPVAVDPTDTGSVDSVFFATLGPEPDPEVAHINLLFDLTLRTDTEVYWYDPVATIRFPAKIPGAPDNQVIGVHLLGSGPGVPAWPPSAWLDLNGDGQPDDTTGGSEPNVPASSLGIEVAAAFASSPYEATPHLVIEMKMPLSIPAGFPDPSGPLASVPDGPGGIYAPDPGLWTVEYQRTLSPDWIWEVGAMGSVKIQPDGAARGDGNLAIDRVVGVEPVDGFEDHDGLVSFAILSTASFDARTLYDVRAVNADDPGQAAWSTYAYPLYVNGDAFEDQVVEFSSADLMAKGVVTTHGTDVMLLASTTLEKVAGNVAGLTPPQAGSVPDGGFQVTGAPLTIKKTGSGNVKLLWGDSCVAADIDYAIYEGVLGVPGSHRPVVCSTSGSTALQIPPGPDDHYYLVVPSSPDGVEGSYGMTSWGEQRPQGAQLAGDPFDPAICMPQFSATTCGP